jgi:hypothetical protein
VKFYKTKEPIQEIGPNNFVIGNNPLEPQLEIGEGVVHIPQNLTISGVDFLDYFTGDPNSINLIKNIIQETRHELEEAFELDADGDIVPSSAKYISDPIWILRNQNDIELRNNFWRYNSGPDSFTDEISF